MSKRRNKTTAIQTTIRLSAGFLPVFLAVFCLFGASLEGGSLIPGGESTVRVAIQTGQSSVTLTVGHGAFTLTDPVNGQEAASITMGQQTIIKASGNGLQVSANGSDLPFSGSRIWIAPKGTATDISIVGTRSYRGSMLVENRGGALTVVNILDVDQYLLGVLPLEMGLSTVPAEALKAQAVVSRTYALKNRNPDAPYDLVSGVSDQMYGGFGVERDYTSAAVEATRGQVIYYDGALIEAFFSANSGGYTEDSENVWNEALAYARAVPSPHDAAATRWLQDNNGYPGNTFQWQLRYTIQDLQTRIDTWNKNNPDHRIQIGSLRSMNAYAYAYDTGNRTMSTSPNASGRVTELVLSGSSGKHTMTKESTRSFLGLRSSRYSLTPEGGVAAFDGTGRIAMLQQGIRESYGIVADGQGAQINRNSNSFFVLTADGVQEMDKDEAGTVQAYVIDGNGYGHGVGMSQWGAIGMASEGMEYRQIIEHYYNQGKGDGRLRIQAIQ